MYPYHYRLLEVDPGVSQEEVRKAYRRLVKKWHPDVNKSPGAAAHFLQIQQAWQVLGDPDKRAGYDNFGKSYGSRSVDPGYHRTPPPPPHMYQQRRTQAYTGYGGRVYYRTVDAAKLKEEEKIRKRDMLIGILVALVIFLISSSGKILPKIQLYFFSNESIAEVYTMKHAVNYYFATADDQVYGEVYPRKKVIEGQMVIDGKMPLESGDKFRVLYLAKKPQTHKISFDHPDEFTLGKYYNMVYYRMMSTPLLDSLARNSMKTVFLYTLCDSVYCYYGVKGIADLYYAQTSPEVNPENNRDSFYMLRTKKRFKKFLAEIREATLPL